MGDGTSLDAGARPAVRVKKRPARRSDTRALHVATGRRPGGGLSGPGESPAVSVRLRGGGAIRRGRDVGRRGSQTLCRRAPPAADGRTTCATVRCACGGLSNHTRRNLRLEALWPNTIPHTHAATQNVSKTHMLKLSIKPPTAMQKAPVKTSSSESFGSFILRRATNECVREKLGRTSA